jgi:hypothetical protein
MIRGLVLALVAGLIAPSVAAAVEVSVVPVVALGKRADWKAAAKLEKRVLRALKKAGHSIKKLSSDAGKLALACKGDFDCLGKLGGDGVSVSMVVWRVKRKRIPEVAVYDGSKQLAKISGKMKRLKKLAKKVVAAIPVALVAEQPEPAPASPVPEVKPAAVELVKAPEAAKPKPALVVAAPPVSGKKPNTEKSNTMAYAMLGTGGAMVGVGSYFGIQALANRSAMGSLPEGPEYDAELKAMKSNSLLADVISLPGLAVAGVGVYLLVR